MKLGYALLGLVALSLAASSASAASKVLADFEPGGVYYGGTEGFFNYAGLADFGTYSNPLGQTSTWIGFKPFQYWGQMIHQGWATPDFPASELQNYTRIEFDVMVDSEWYPGSNQISFGLLLGSTFHELPITVDFSTPGVPQHVVADYSSLTAEVASATYFEVQTNFRPGYRWEWDTANPSAVAYNPHIYFDNFVFTTGGPSLLKGDFDLDGEILDSDASYFLMALAGDFEGIVQANPALTTEQAVFIGDFDGDGEVLDSDAQGFLLGLAGGRPAVLSGGVLPEPVIVGLLAPVVLGLSRQRK